MRKVLVGILDSLKVGLILTLVLSGTGFLPLGQEQKEAHAIFWGWDCIRGACPATCTTSAYGVTSTCTVTTGAMYGTCSGSCGFCSNGQTCKGTAPKPNPADGTFVCVCIQSGC